MISSICWGVCALILACHHHSLGVRIICGVLSAFFFFAAMACHRKVVARLDMLEGCFLDFVKKQNDVNKKAVKALGAMVGLSEDDLK